MKRSIIKIDQELCTGCGDCIVNCPEGALQLIDGKARLVSEIHCDGLGACIGHCPEGAITVEEREAERYDERKVIEAILPQGHDLVRAHLRHLSAHEQWDDLRVAQAVLREKGVKLDEPTKAPAAQPPAAPHHHAGGSCPGARAFAFGAPGAKAPKVESGAQNWQSRLSHWPIQLHLLSPDAPYLEGRDLLLSADCVAHSVAGFHERFLEGRALAIACPKLDQGQEIYLDKLVAMIDRARIKTITVMTMEVPCCGGLVRLVNEAASRASRKVEIRAIQVGIRGDLLSDERIA